MDEAQTICSLIPLPFPTCSLPTPLPRLPSSLFTSPSACLPMRLVHWPPNPLPQLWCSLTLFCSELLHWQQSISPISPKSTPNLFRVWKGSFFYTHGLASVSSFWLPQAFQCLIKYHLLSQWGSFLTDLNFASIAGALYIYLLVCCYILQLT